MKTKAFIKNMGAIILFYFLGTAFVVVLLGVYDYTFTQVSYIFYAMAIVSFLLIFFYARKMICVDCKLMNRIIIIILIIMTILLTWTAYDMAQPWELNLYI